jgi:hypothetical protein
VVAASQIAGCGWHDTYFRWDISIPHAVLGRLKALPHRGSLTRPGKALFAEPDRFGQWRHLLGSQYVLLVYTVEPKGGVIRRMEVQAHLGPSGEDDLCPVADFAARFEGLQKRMAMVGVLPPTDPRVVRVDPAVDVVYEDPRVGYAALEALRHARHPNGWYAEWQGPPPYTTVAIKSGRSIVGRAYCRNTKLRNGGERWGKIRFEREHRFDWARARPVEELAIEAAAAVYWGSVFGRGRPAGRVTRIEREVQTIKLIERVELGEITYQQFERMTGFLDAERLGLANRAYTLQQLRARRREARELGLSPTDTAFNALDVSLDEVLAVPRSAWQSDTALPAAA